MKNQPQELLEPTRPKKGETYSNGFNEENKMPSIVSFGYY